MSAMAPCVFATYRPRLDLVHGGRNQRLLISRAASRNAGQGPDFLGYNREASATVAGTGGLDAGVERNILVWKAISSIAPMMWPICSAEASMSAMAEIA